MNTKSVISKGVTVGLVVGGVMLAGFLMAEFKDVGFVKKSRDGFQGII